jgi:hypothetical protein
VLIGQSLQLYVSCDSKEEVEGVADDVEDVLPGMLFVPAAVDSFLQSTTISLNNNNNNNNNSNCTANNIGKMSESIFFFSIICHTFNVFNIFRQHHSSNSSSNSKNKNGW